MPPLRYSRIFTVKFDPGLAQNLLQEQAAEKVTDRETVGLGNFKHMISGNKTYRSDHVFHDNGRVSGNMLALVAPTARV